MKTLLAALLLSTTVLAQAPTQAPRTAPPKEIVFGDADVIGGEGVGPEVELLKVTPPPKFRSIIKVREHFREKTLQSVNEL